MKRKSVKYSTFKWPSDKYYVSHESYIEVHVLHRTVGNWLNVLPDHIFKKIIKNLKYVEKSKPNKSRPSGFTRPTYLSPGLCSFLNLGKNSQLSRVEVTKRIVDYIRDNNLQNPQDRRQILPDTQLQNENIRLHCYLDSPVVPRIPNRTWIIDKHASEDLQSIII